MFPLVHGILSGQGSPEPLPLTCAFPMKATQQTLDDYFNGEGYLAVITDDYDQSFSAPIGVVVSDTTYYATTEDGSNTRLPTALKTSAIEVAITLPEHPSGSGLQDIAFVAQTVLANTSIEDLITTISVIRYEDGTASLVVSIPGEPLQTFPLTGSTWVLGIVIADGTGTFDLYLDGVDLGLTDASITVEPWLYFALGVRAANTLDGGQITMGLRTAEEQFAYVYPDAHTVCYVPPPPVELSIDEVERVGVPVLTGEVTEIQQTDSIVRIEYEEARIDVPVLTGQFTEVISKEALVPIAYGESEKVKVSALTGWFTKIENRREVE